MPTPRFSKGVRNVPVARRQTPASSDSVTTIETISGVTPGGQYLIRGIPTPTRVSTTFAKGDFVYVAWKKNKPFMILNMSTRRGPGHDVPVGEPGVEMLIAGPAVAGDISGTKFDIWFRNENQTTLLDVRTAIATAGFVGGAPGFTSIIGLTLLGWGLDQRRFVVSFFNPVSAGVSKPYIAVFKLTNARSAITTTAKAVLERVYDLSLSSINLGNTTWFTPGASASMETTLGVAVSVGHYAYLFIHLDPLPIFTEVRYSDGPPPVGTPPETTSTFPVLQTVRAEVESVVLKKNKHLIVNFSVVVGNAAASDLPEVFFTYPFVVDLTAGTILFDGLANRGSWGVLEAQLYDGLHFVNPNPEPTPGEYDLFTSFSGSTVLRMVPTKNENVLRFFATGSGQAGSGATFKWAGARIASGLVSLVFQESSLGATVGVTTLSSNARYVMWMRHSGGDPPSSYDFKDGVHITDLGPTEVLAVTDKIVLTDHDSILAFMDETPYLVRPDFLWIGRNDLRTVEPAGAATLAALLSAAGLSGVSAGPRRKTQFISYLAAGGLPKVPIAEGPSTALVFQGGLRAADLKPIPKKAAFLAVDVLDTYDVDGVQDPVTGGEAYIDFLSRVQYMTPE